MIKRTVEARVPTRWYEKLTKIFSRKGKLLDSATDKAVVAETARRIAEAEKTSAEAEKTSAEAEKIRSEAILTNLEGLETLIRLIESMPKGKARDQLQDQLVAAIAVVVDQWHMQGGQSKLISSPHSPGHSLGLGISRRDALETRAEPPARDRLD